MELLVASRVAVTGGGDRSIHGSDQHHFGGGCFSERERERTRARKRERERERKKKRKSEGERARARERASGEVTNNAPVGEGASPRSRLLVESEDASNEPTCDG